jgi:acyl transferase domain-containing protein
MLPGVGDQHVRMGQDLYALHPTFRDHVDRCAEFLTPLLGEDIRGVLYPTRGGAEPAAAAVPSLQRMLRGAPAAPHALDGVIRSQPAMFVVEYALAQLWLSYGVRPDALVGYSIGEYVAACLAGVFTWQDALSLVVRRAKAIEALAPGAMLAVPLSEEDLLPRLGAELEISAVNGPLVCVVAGPQAAVAALEQSLAVEGIASRYVRAPHAFHTRYMRPIAAELTEQVRGFQLAPPRIPFVSNVTGTWITAEQAVSPDYWTRHLCERVRFGDAVRTLWQANGRVLLEVGPGLSLSSLALLHPDRDVADQLAVASMHHPLDRQPDELCLYSALGRLWLAGVPFDAAAVQAGRLTGAAEPVAVAPEPPTTTTTPAAPAPHDGATGRAVAEMWRALLGHEEIGPNDNFLALGGNSLLAAQLATRIKKAFGVTLSVGAIFHHPTLAELAPLVERKAGWK